MERRFIICNNAFSTTHGTFIQYGREKHVYMMQEKKINSSNLNMITESELILCSKPIFRNIDSSKEKIYLIHLYRAVLYIQL